MMKKSLKNAIFCLLSLVSFSSAQTINDVCFEKLSTGYQTRYGQFLTGKSALALPSTLAQSSRSWANIYQMSRNAVVQFFVQAGRHNMFEPYKAPVAESVRGSGFVISADGYIITNFHVVEDPLSVYVQFPGVTKNKYEVAIVGFNPVLDIALWRLTDKALADVKRDMNVKQLAYLPLGNSDLVSGAQEVLLLGYPLGQEQVKSSTGCVSGRERDERELIQTTTPTNPGNSGGPFLDNNGNVIGVCVSGVDGADGVNYFIPINNVIAQLPLFLTQRRVNNPWWGISFKRPTETTLRYFKVPCTGVHVTSVEPGALFDKAGIKKGDVITHVGGYSLDRSGYLELPWMKHEKITMLDYLERFPSGSNVNVTVYRDRGNKQQCTLQLCQTAKRAIDYFYQGYEQSPDYLMFGGLVVTPLTKNYIETVKKTAKHNDAIDPSYVQAYEVVAYQDEPRLIVASTLAESFMQREGCFSDGDVVIDKVNGIDVGTLEEFNAAIKAGNREDAGVVTIETEGGAFVALSNEQIVQEEAKLGKLHRYQPSGLVSALKTKTIS